MAYFVGNVLASTGPVENDVTFDFSEKEAQDLCLDNIPIRIEHESGLQVGRVLRSWNGENGEKWIVGQLDNNTLESRYARYAIHPTESTGHTLYKGLSLQHVWRGHKASNGKLIGRGEKKPVEISICVDPRRPNCYIRHVASNLSTNQSEYKGASSDNHIMSTDSTPAPAESAPVADEQTPTEAAPVAMETQEEVPQNRDELLKVILDSEAQLQTATSKAQEFEKMYLELKSKMEEQKKNEQLELRTKADNLSRALVDSWSAQLNGLSEQEKKAIYSMAQNYPEQSVKMLEIAHKASKKSASLEQQLEQAKQQKERNALESQVAAVLSKKRARTFPTVQEEVHRASKKSAPSVTNPFLAPTISTTAKNMRESNPALFEALASMKCGSARASMDAVANMYK